ncbi:protein slender lobes-like [Trichoplusia ni]|uniref:Protein slender lobes-like n=1 Tax=Trichoplusia ni TaxID=7111 RepID=A0A7E5WGU7_TRINI|nr:protein slender lobes-like [Trichoplusia ni]
MEEEVGIKVTRLRRRLSVDADDVLSPSSQSTPTKKRSGRLAAKPQLELIDENVPDLVPNKTTKAIAAEEKVLTPARRSQRIRSNTSILSETPEIEEKSTPARRTTRVKSNTSLVAEVTSTTTPRAKRAARRNSQIGSDNEAPITPVRQTRRTRKDSTSSVDKTADKGSQIKEAIVEETENSDNNKKDSPIRKSPRLSEKALSKAQPVVQIEKLDLTSKTDTSMTQKENKETTKAVEEKPSENNNLSITSSKLIKDLDDAPKKAKNDMNKSANALYDEALPKPRRSRTKSWTTISVEPSHDNNFNSDSEVFKKDSKKKNSTLNTSNMSGSGDGIMNTSNKQNEDVNTSVLSDKKNKKRQEKSLIMDTETTDPVLSGSPKLKKSEVISEDSSDSKKDKKERKSLNTSKEDTVTEKLFQQPPTGLITSLVFIDDSDSNHESVGKGNTEKDFDSGDQCVPVVDHGLGSNETKEAANNLSYEPMDVDETLPENISLSTFAQKNNSVKLDDKENESQKRKSLNISQIKDNSLLNSKRKSSISNVVSEDTLDGTNLPSRTSLDKSSVNNSYTNNSKRNSSVFNVSTIDLKHNIESNVKRSKTKSLTAEEVKDVIMEEITNKSNRRPSLLEDSIKNSSTTSAGALVIDESVNTSLNKSKNKNSVSAIVAETEKRKSSNSDSVNVDDVMNKSENKSKDKSSILNEVNDADKSLSKSKRKSSIGQENHDKTDNANKSTLVLSQLKDLSQSELNAETNNLKESNDTTAKLSKSVNTPNVTLDKDSDKKNLSLTYLTSTPLQQKSLKKLGMQINSSIITPSSTTKIEKKNTTKNSTKEASIMSQDSSEDDESEEDDDSEASEEEEESSLEKSNLMDDEAEEAGEGYESGDSRDEDEKEYEEQNEIVIKGETLDSDDEEEYSDDEYEKDSFIVSSDEEDNDLLSGSGDDLDMSDNELKMTSKSKKKYNERKSKEQKKASREMFEARHQLDDKTGSKKKNNRQRLDSTSSESDDEVKTQPKKRRQRIDSSQDRSNVQSDADKSLTKKKTPRLMSVSFCEDNEKETTIREDAESEEKSKGRENKSSQEDISNAQSEADKSISKRKIARRMSVSICEDDEKEKSVTEVSGTEPRNKKLPLDNSQNVSNDQSDPEKTLSSKKKKINRRMSVSISEDIETNEEEITIREEAEPGKDDPLALQHAIKTEPKTPQKDLNISTVAVTSVDDAEQVNVDENVTILESNQTSDPLQTTIAPDADIHEDDDSEDSISENEEITENYESMLNNLNNITSKKNKTQDISLNLDKKTKQKKNKEPIVDQLNLTQVKKSKKKNATVVDEQPKVEESKNTEKEKQVLVFSEGSSDSIDMKLLFPEDSNDSEAIGVNKNEQAKDSKKTDENTEVPDDFIPLKRTEGKTNILENSETINKSVDESVLNVSSKKKNKRKSAQTVENEDIMNEQETNLNFFIDTTGDLADSEKNDANTSMKSSAKKKKQKNNVSFVNIEEEKPGHESDDAPLEVSYQSNRNTTQIEEEPAAEILNESAKKKKKKNKKGLNSSVVEEISLFGQKANAGDKSNTSITEGSAKKKKKLLESQVEQEKEGDTNVLVQNVSIGSAKKQKQKTADESSGVEASEEGNNLNNEDTSKKRKRKSSANQTIEDIVFESELKLDTSKDSTAKQKKKKRKISQTNDDTEKTDVQEIVKESQDQSDVKNSKKKNQPLLQDIENGEKGAKKKNKKRKERDDDECSNISKIHKQNSFDKVHVPRLPTDVLQQLEDKPKLETLDAEKPKVIATSSFLVEQTKKRRAKPSNYLEESVYLNDSVEEKKQRGLVKNPKVLPFIPTASTSHTGFTTKFEVNIIPQTTQFVAQSSEVPNFKNDYLSKKRIKKLGTFEKCKRLRSVKLSKF